jgi:Fur family transcriptional regulator, peroxide stress response regulator
MDIDARRRSFTLQCRDRGLRLTAQRMAVFQALVGDSTHPTAEFMFIRIRETLPSLSLSTVYRILESLESEGLIRRVSTSNGVTRFDANLDPHQHLICRVCGRMTDFAEASLSRLPLPDIQADGFFAEELDIRVVGTCRGCRRPPIPKRSRKTNVKVTGAVLSPGKGGN